MKKNKAGGIDAIPAEVYKYGDDLLHQLILNIWTNEAVPQDFKLQ